MLNKKKIERYIDIKERVASICLLQDSVFSLNYKLQEFTGIVLQTIFRQMLCFSHKNLRLIW